MLARQVVETPVVDTSVVEEEDMTYLGSAVEDVSGQRILGTLWNYHNDNLVFDFENTASLVKSVEPTKTNVISTASKMYNPLGVISSITVHSCTLCPNNRTIEC